jgi:hypothetical protein
MTEAEILLADLSRQAAANTEEFLQTLEAFVAAKVREILKDVTVIDDKLWDGS